MDYPKSRSPFLQRSFEYLSQTRSLATALIYVEWMQRYILFHHFRQAQDMLQDARALLDAYLLHLADRKHVSPRTQNQAWAALFVLYREILEAPFDIEFRDLRARTGFRLPEILSVREVDMILSALTGGHWLMASLLAKSGLKVGECAALKIQAIDFEAGIIDLDDYWTIFPQELKDPLQRRIRFVIGCYELKGLRERQQYYVFPEIKLFDPDIEVCEYRSVHRNTIQKTIERAAQKARDRQKDPLIKQGHCQSLRDSFAVRCLENGYTIRDIKEFLGIQDTRQVMRYLSCLHIDVIDLLA